MSSDVDDVIAAARHLCVAARDDQIEIDEALHRCFDAIQKLRSSRRGKSEKCTSAECGTCDEYSECELMPIFLRRQG